MSKRPYEAVEIKDVDVEFVAERFDGREIAVGFDAASEIHYACLMGAPVDDYYVISFDAVDEIGQMIQLLASLPCRWVTTVIEPTGSYHEALKAELEKAGITVKRMGTEKAGRADDLFDNVPSMHDGKAAYLLARLHQMGLSDQWKDQTVLMRRMRAILDRLDAFDESINRNTGRLEAYLARVWPELRRELKLSTATLQELVIAFGSPQAVADRPDKARDLMRRVSRGGLTEETIERVVTSAGQTVGVPMVAEEVENLRDIAATLRQSIKDKRRASRRLEQLADEADDQQGGQLRRMQDFGGIRLAAALMALMSGPANYQAAAQYQKAAGLNLKERSSGKHKGELHITKRGPGKVRKYLYLLALRMVGSQTKCPWVRAWYQKRLKLNGFNRAKGLIAVMRKLLGALFHIGRGAEYDPAKLFDLSRLDLSAEA